MLSSLCVWQSLAIPGEALRYDWGFSTSLTKFVRSYALYRLLPTGHSRLLASLGPLGAKPLTQWLAVTRDRTVSSVMRTYVYDGIDYREIEIMAPRGKTIAKVSLGFCSFDSSADHMMVFPRLRKLADSRGRFAYSLHQSPISDKINRILMPLISTTAFAQLYTID